MLQPRTFDGVYVDGEEGPEFVPPPPLTDDDVQQIVLDQRAPDHPPVHQARPARRHPGRPPLRRRARAGGHHRRLRARPHRHRTARRLFDRYRQCAVEHGQALRDRITGSTGHLTEEVSYGFPYRAGFMTDIAVIGLKRLHDITADDGWKEFALEIIDDQLEHLMLPSGLLFYKEPPENRYPLTAMFDLEVMTYAWRWTGEVKYLKHGIQLLRMLGLHDRRLEAHSAFLHEAPEGALYQEIRFFNRDSHRTHDYRFELPFLELLDELDLLKQFEPPEIDLSGIEDRGKAP